MAGGGAPPGPLGTGRAWMPALQSLRGVAALWVLLYHLQIGLWEAGERLMPLAGVRFGWAGVDLFFVLSAYLLGQPFFHGGAPRYPAFLLDRFLRVAPAFYVSAAVSAALLLWQGGYPWDPVRIALNLAFLGNFDLASVNAINTVFWTLAVEMQFYVLLPLLVLAFQGRRWPVGLAVCFAVALLYRGLLFGQGERGFDLRTFTLPAFLGHFALGLCAARLGPIRAPVGSGVRRAIFALGVPLVLVPVVLWTPAGSLAFGSGTLAGQMLLRPVVACGFALIILATASGGWPGRVLSMVPLKWLGRISYSLYLMHLAVIFLLLRILGWPRTMPGIVAVAVAGSLLAAWALHALVEAPAERWRRRRKAATRRPAGTTA